MGHVRAAPIPPHTGRKETTRSHCSQGAFIVQLALASCCPLPAKPLATTHMSGGRPLPSPEPGHLLGQHILPSSFLGCLLVLFFLF